MARSLIVLWLTLLSAIASVAVFAQFWIDGRRQSAETRVREILETQLGPFSDSISNVIEGYSIDLQRTLADIDLEDRSQCVELARHPLADLVVVINGRGQLHFPSGMSASDERWPLVEEAQQLLREQLDPRPQSQNAVQLADSLAEPPVNDQLDASALQSPPQSRLYEANRAPSNNQMQPQLVVPETESAAVEQAVSDLAGASEEQIEDDAGDEAEAPAANGKEFGWITWYHRRGMVLGFWWHQEPGWRTFVVLPRARWTADIVASLPDSRRPLKRIDKSPLSDSQSDADPDDPIRLMAGVLRQLVDVEGNLIYQWGDAPAEFWTLVAENTPEPTAELPAQNPLEGWRLRTFATDTLTRRLAGDPMVLPIWLAVAGLSAALLLVGLLLTVSLRRQVRLAASRVSFVNQVSHELRTPLTNICMYADLLANDLESEVDLADMDLSEKESGLAESRQRLERISVIRNESQRLSRLISNVLEFAGSDTGARHLRMQPRVLDDLVHEVLATFQPRLTAAQFQVELELNAKSQRLFDPDAAEQILVNLISNAEKYAVTGRWLRIETTEEGDSVAIRVCDRGVGVPSRLADKIFAPFQRGSDRLEDPAGTGIGLTIVRELARRHGGDCQLVDAQPGATFQCTLRAPISS